VKPVASLDLRERLYRVRLDAVMAGQTGVAAGVSWLVAADLLGHHVPIFAPLSAVVVLVGGTGRRLRRALEMVFGVALGIAVGDGLIFVIGVGAAQIAAVVILAILVAAFLSVGAVATGQAAASAVLVATLAPPRTGIYYSRFVDALVGGLVGIAVLALLLPFNPLTRVRRAADAALTCLADALATVGQALARHEADLAERALQQLRRNDFEYQNLRDAIAAGDETATLAPIRWRSRPALYRYQHGAVHMERATRNARVLSRRARSAVRDAEAIPAELPTALGLLADGVSTLRRELADGRDPVRARERIMAAVDASAAAYAAGVGFSGSVVVAQIRSAAFDLLLASGLDELAVDRRLRATVHS
jgi:uncharacterized membrane protein YgaE (UPF0421/DUF939 family)